MPQETLGTPLDRRGVPVNQLAVLLLPSVSTNAMTSVAPNFSENPHLRLKPTLSIPTPPKHQLSRKVKAQKPDGKTSTLNILSHELCPPPAGIPVVGRSKMWTHRVYIQTSICVVFAYLSEI